ncbi:hypothetical protein Droror1_Dr00002230, partial [Drosera rotundifolia]
MVVAATDSKVRGIWWRRRRTEGGGGVGVGLAMADSGGCSRRRWRTAGGGGCESVGVWGCEGVRDAVASTQDSPDSSEESLEVTGNVNHEVSNDSKAVWEDNVDPDSMTYEELLDLGEAVGTESRGLSHELIKLLPTSSFPQTLILKFPSLNPQILEISSLDSLPPLSLVATVTSVSSSTRIRAPSSLFSSNSSGETKDQAVEGVAEEGGEEVIVMWRGFRGVIVEMSVGDDDQSSDLKKRGVPMLLVFGVGASIAVILAAVFHFIFAERGFNLPLRHQPHETWFPSSNQVEMVSLLRPW